MSGLGFVSPAGQVGLKQPSRSISDLETPSASPWRPDGSTGSHPECPLGPSQQLASVPLVAKLPQRPSASQPDPADPSCPSWFLLHPAPHLSIPGPAPTVSLQPISLSSVGCLQMGDRLLSHSSGQGRPGLADSSSCCTWRCLCQPSLPVAPALWLRSSRCVRQQVWREQEECAEGAEPFALSGSGTQAGVGEGSQRRQPGPQRAPHQEAVWAGGRSRWTAQHTGHQATAAVPRKPLFLLRRACDSSKS